MEGPDKIDLVHLRREARTALELAIVAMVPQSLMERLAAATGMLEALAEIPADSPPARALVPTTVTRARSAIDAWHVWEREHLPHA
jgi:hypothetical protein